jgi:ADP-ribose pyrophosphatase YjhB (NUDIX family)
MELRTDLFDLWVYHRQNVEPEYFLLHTSQEKADKWFKGGRFWQILGGHVGEDEEIADALLRPLEEQGMVVEGIWAVEHSYIIYNLRRRGVELYPVFAARVVGPVDVELTWEHSEAGWFTADECYERVRFRGTREGLDWTRHYVSEVEEPLQELRVV